MSEAVTTKARPTLRCYITGPRTIEFRNNRGGVEDVFCLDDLSPEILDRAALEGVARVYMLKATVNEIMDGSGFPERKVPHGRRAASPRMSKEERKAEAQRERLLKKLADAKAKEAEIAAELDALNPAMAFEGA